MINVYQNILDKKDSQLKPFFSNIDQIEKIDNLKIHIKTKEPDPQLNQKINALLISKENNMGTGPYKLQAFSKIDGLVLEAYTNYWGDLPQIRNVVFQSIQSKNERLK